MADTDDKKANGGKSDDNGYRSILKGTSIFGGVQVFQIMVNLLRGKFVAMFLGPDGMGVASMFTSASNTISRFASLGLNLAFVKEVASSKESDRQLATALHVAGLLIRLTALLGAIVCAVMSPWLSRWSFGSDAYAWQFVLLAVAVWFTVAGFGQSSLLQGLHKVKILSATSLAGAVAGLVAGVPLYYFFGDKGIVPAMIVLGLTSYLFYSYGLRRATPRHNVRFRWSEHGPMVKRMLGTGMILLASSLINTTCTWLINIYIRMHGDIADVGLFNAANSITLQYAGVVFTAMALDYFPRLTAAASDNRRMWGIVNRQSEIVALIAGPLTILLVATAPLVIRLLLTERFLPVTELMRWLGLGILLKAVAYPLGYIAFAKDNRRLFFWLEAVVCNALYLGMSLVFYRLFGMMGLGYAAVAEQGACVILYMSVNRAAYGYRPDRKAVRETAIGILLCVSAFCVSLASDGAPGYWLMACVFLISAARSFLTLKVRLRER